MGEAFLGAFLQAAIDKLCSRELLNFALKWGVDAHKMKKVMLKLLAVIDDAEEKQFKSYPVRLWLDELRDVVYDAEDVLDLFETELLRYKLNQPDSPSQTDYTSPQVGDRMTSSINSDMDSFSLNIEIEHKIKEITGRLEDIANEKNDLGLEGTRRSSAGGSSIGTIEPRLPTSSLVNEPHVYGREKDVEEMIKLLLSKEICVDNIGVVPVVGPGGTGKTTFAQLLYNHTAVKKHFDLKAWVCVSDVFDVIRISKGIIESATSKCCDLNELSAVHEELKKTLEDEELKKTLEGKKFLLILDDVWTEKCEDWNALSTPFRSGAKGSKVLITTRSEKVSSNTGTVSAQRLELLREEDCFSLFKRHAFQNQNVDAHLAFVERIGKEIIKKCKGLPLAAKALGGVMRSKQRESEWEDILKSEIWDLLDQETEVGPALWLSYYHLPTHLKRCFVYCGIFPKDYEFNKEELICLWMAEGFVGQKDNKRMEDIGEGYFYELVSRSFFQQSSEDNSKFVMHDLINDMARAASRETCFTKDDEVQGKKLISDKTRHLTYQPHRYNFMSRFEAFFGATKLRSFLSPQKHEWQQYSLSCQVPHDLISRLVCLRVFSLRRYDNIFELPESIGNLVHLRYLDLSFTRITRLPESINSLYNLQTLLLGNCMSLKELPPKMGNLINLRYLGIDRCNGLQKMSRGIGRLKELQILPRFIVDENNGPRIEDLTELEHLCGTLEILGLESIRDPIRRKINFRNKQHLRTLKLIWDYDDSVVNDSQVKSIAELLLDRLQPHANLKELIVEGYYGTSFPNWLEDPSCCSNLVNLHILQCKYCKSLPNSLGQLPFLEELFISGMPEWEEWIGVGQEDEQEFPRLRNLQLQYCPKLKIVSHCFPALVELKIDGCGEFTTFSRRLPSLNHLSLVGSGYELLQNVASFTPLLSLKIHRIRRLTCLPHEESFLQCLTRLEGLEISGCHELTSLWSCNEVVWGGLQHHHHLTSLKTLKISCCHNLEKLPYGLHNLTFLEKLAIDDCLAIESFPEEMELPTMLKYISISSRNLKSLPEVFFMHTSLEGLEIMGCSSLNSFSRRDAVCSSSIATINISKLKRIRISNCDKLQSLPEGLHNLTSLESLSISACHSLTSLPDQMHCLSCLETLEIKDCPHLLSFPEGGLPSTKLRFLQINGCEDLKSLPNQMVLLTSLEVLEIRHCPHLLFIPEGGLPSTKLRCLKINNCKSFESLVDHLYSLTSLRSLGIIDCPALKSFPKGSFPSNLKSLEISIDCNTFLPSSSWEFHFCRFTSLKELEIYGCEGIESFHDWLLPCTLISLQILNFPHLKALPKGLQHLTSLEGLEIDDCPKLASLPDQGLPTTLCSLSINQCPLLKQWCENDKREGSPILGKIPHVTIDHEHPIEL